MKTETWYKWEKMWPKAAFCITVKATKTIFVTSKSYRAVNKTVPCKIAIMKYFVCWSFCHLVNFCFFNWTRLGCQWNGKCVPENTTWTEEKGGMCTRYKCQKEKDGPYPKYKVKKEHEGKPFVIYLILRINRDRPKVLYWWLPVFDRLYGR